MKTKATLIIAIIALFGFMTANAQGKGKGHKGHNKAHKHSGYDDYNDYRRPGTVYYPREVYYGRQYQRNLPPGQAKKLYGHKSAKAFAPGQQKKGYSNVYQTRRGVAYPDYYDQYNYRNYRNRELAGSIGNLLGF